MSSILKALKKLEDESSSPVADASWFKKVDEKEAGLERLKDHFLTYRQRYSTFALLLLVLAAGAALNSKLGIVKKTPASLTFAKQQVETATPPSSLKNELPASPNSKPTGNIKRQSRGIQPKEASRLPAALLKTKEGAEILKSKADKSPAAAFETPAVEPRQPGGHLLSDKSSKIALDSKPDIENHAPEDDPALQLPKISKPGQFTDTEILDDPNMKLQAISWSENTERRMAVINSKIVHPGDRVGSYIVLQINQDDVIVRQGEELRKMLFRLR